jgi:hypothetical protein
MTHRADQIIEAIAELVRARMEPDGFHVFKHRRASLAHDQDELPAISIDVGPRGDPFGTVEFMDWTLVVPITAIAVGPEEEARALVIHMQREVHIALMATADTALGLAFVHQTEDAGWPDGILVDAEGESPAYVLEASWAVKFRMSRADPGA